jgi:hypothetical protein
MKKKREEAEKRFREHCEELAETCLCSVGVREYHVYIGSFGELVNISNKLEYHVEPKEEIGGEEVISITLKEIYEQVKKMWGSNYWFDSKTYTPMITVFDESPMRSKIYQCGNYGDGLWVKLGEIQGYA